jgi:hypothetical protein
VPLPVPFDTDERFEAEALQLKVDALAKMKKENLERQSLINKRIISDKLRMINEEIEAAEIESKLIAQRDADHSDMMEKHEREQERSKRADSKAKTEALMGDILRNCEVRNRNPDLSHIELFELRNREHQTSISQQVQSDELLARSLFNNLDFTEVEGNRPKEPTYWEVAKQEVARNKSVSECLLQESAAGLSDKEDHISLASAHITSPPMPKPIVLTSENDMPQLIEITEFDDEVAAKPRLPYVPRVTKEIPYPTAPYSPNERLIELQADFTAKEAALLKTFKNEEKIRRNQNYIDSIRMKELGLNEAFDCRVKGEDTEFRAKVDQLKSERSTVQASLELQAVNQYKHLRSGFERDKHLLQQSCLKTVQSKTPPTPESLYMNDMTSKAIKNNCTGMAAMLVEKHNPTIKTSANKAQLELAGSTFRGTKGDDIKKVLTSKVQDSTHLMLRTIHQMKSQRLEDLYSITSSVLHELKAKDGEQVRLMVGYETKLQFNEECILDLTAVMIDILLMEATLIKMDAYMDERS